MCPVGAKVPSDLATLPVERLLIVAATLPPASAGVKVITSLLEVPPTYRAVAPDVNGSASSAAVTSDSITGDERLASTEPRPA